MALTKVKGSGVEGITNLSNATFLSVNASEVATLLTSAVINSEGGAVTTNIAQGLCKFFSNIDGDAGTISTRDSFNQSGIIDRGTGDYDLTFTNNMGNDDYATMNNADSASGHIAMCYSESEQHTTGCRVYVVEFQSDVSQAPTDTNMAMTSAHGDLA